MEFRTLGPLEVLAEGRPVALGGAKQRALLAVLLLHANEVVSRDRLIDELWGASPPDTATTALQVYVSQLRKALGRDLILTQPPGYLIRVSDGELDLHRFERLVAAARAEEPVQAARLLREGLALWRGAPLAELSDSFAPAERARLEEQRLAALEQRIEADLALGRHAELVPELEGLVRAAAAARTSARPADAGPLSLRPPGRRARGLPLGPAVAGRGARAQAGR